MEELLTDALSLLKEQEPVDPAIGGNQNSCWYFICPRCQLAIDKGDKYCRHCGRAVKWDG
jgi:predicted amidophosphoribosyltransferase